MPNKVLSFDVESTKIVDEIPDSKFMLIEIQAFSSGRNLHDMKSSETVLKKTAHTIYNVPIIYNIVPYINDFGTHISPDKSLICGFTLPHTETFRRLDDGRLSLFVKGAISKRYSPKVIEILKRDGGNKKVSVEMELIEAEDSDDGLVDMIDYSYLGVCMLGANVQEASPLAHLDVLSFAKENATIKKEYEVEFSKYSDIDFTIPQVIKNNAQKGLELYKDKGLGGTSISLAIARHLFKSEKVSIDKIKLIHKFLSRHVDSIKNKENPDGNYVSWMLHGGKDALKWSSDIVNAMKDVDEKQLSYFGDIIGFPYGSMKDVNPAIKGIDPPVSLAQANQIAAQADSIGSDDKKNGWAIAISSFKKTHKVEDGKWVKREKEKKEEMSVEDKELEKTEEMSVEEKTEEKPAEEMAAEDKKQEDQEEKAEESEEQKEEAKEETKMSLDMNLDMAALLAMLQSETEDYKALVAEHESGGVQNYASLMCQMYAKMCKMADDAKAAQEDKDAYMAENEQLKKFKKDTEDARFSFEVESTLNEVSESGMPKDKADEMREKSKEFSLENIGVWKNEVKALAFAYAKDKDKKPDGLTRMAFPWLESKKEKTGIFWLGKE